MIGDGNVVAQFFFRRFELQQLLMSVHQWNEQNATHDAPHCVHDKLRHHKHTRTGTQARRRADDLRIDAALASATHV